MPTPESLDDAPFPDPVFADPEPDSPTADDVVLSDPEGPSVSPSVSSPDDQMPRSDGGEVPPAHPPSAVAPPTSVAPPTPQSYQPPPPPPQPEAPKFYSVDELQRAVDQGVISQNQMVEQLQWQSKEQAKKEAIEEIRRTNQQQTVRAQLMDYHQLIPGWNQVGTPANQQAQPAYSRLLALGFPANESTELIALEQTFGTVAQLKQGRATQDRTRQLRDASPSVSRRATPPAPAPTRQDPLEALTIEEKRQYKAYIEKGLYANWDAVRKEVAYVPRVTHSPRMGRHPKASAR